MARQKSQFSLKEHMNDEDDRLACCLLYMANYMLFFWIQLALSIVLITFYVLLTLFMGHNECRYQKVNDDKAPPPVDPSKLPNVTSTMQLCFIIGLSLHVLIFLNDIYF